MATGSIVSGSAATSVIENPGSVSKAFSASLGDRFPNGAAPAGVQAGRTVRHEANHTRAQEPAQTLARRNDFIQAGPGNGVNQRILTNIPGELSSAIVSAAALAVAE